MMKFLQTIKNSIPNTITCCNLLSGCLAVIFSFHYNEIIAGMRGFQWVFIFIGAAAVFDFCDGLMARLLHAYSDLGKELDSLADLISFGLAPGLLVYNTINAQHQEFTPWSLVSLAIPAFAALRLAKFNIDDRQTTSFIGMPVPANALFWIGASAWMHEYGYVGDIPLAVAILLFSYLMVSNIKMFSLKFKNLRFADNVVRYFMILAAVMFVACYQVSGLAWTIIMYIILSVFSRKSVD